MPTNNPRLDLASAFNRKLTEMISGFQHSMPSRVGSLMVAGKSMTVAEVAIHLQSMLSRLTTVEKAWHALKEALLFRSQGMPADRAFYAALVMSLKAQFGLHEIHILKNFGIDPPKTRTRLTRAAAAIAKAKSAATRALRNTRGKKQRKLVTLAGQATVRVLGPDGAVIGATAESSKLEVATPPGTLPPNP